MRIKNIESQRFSSSYGNNNSYGQPLGLKSIVIITVTSEDLIRSSSELYTGIYIPDILPVMIDYVAKSFIGKEFDIKNTNFFADIPFVCNSGTFKSIQGAIQNCILQIIFKENNLSIVEGLKIFLQKEYQRDSHSIPIKYYLSGGSVAYSIEETLNDAKAALNTNYDGFKMRCGLQHIDVDYKRVSSVRSFFEENNKKKDNYPINLMVDFIQGTLRPPLSAEKTAFNINYLRNGILWFEEPLDPDKLFEYKKLRNNIDPSISLAVGESFTTFTEYQAFSEFIQFFQLDVTHGGGYIDLFHITNNLLSIKPNLQFTSHVWGSGLAILLNLAFARATNIISWFEIPMVELEINQNLFNNLDINKIRFLSDQDIDELLNSINLKQLDKFKFVEGSGYKIK